MRILLTIALEVCLFLLLGGVGYIVLIIIGTLMTRAERLNENHYQ